MSVHFSSATDLWATPQDFFDQLNKRFGFTLDVCALPENAKCARYFTPEQDGLKQKWTGVCWMNPPYGRTIGLWMKKAWESACAGATVVCLVPARTDTAWWHDYAAKGHVTFLRGRLKFGGHENSAPFPSAVVTFMPPICETRSHQMPDDPREVAAGWKRETDALNAKITALTAVMDAARIHLATHPVFRSKFIGDAGSEARLRQNDQIISEDNLRAAIAAANF